MIPVVFQGDGVLDLVISADPDQVPYSIFVMFQLLQEKFRVRGSTHVHSSVTSKCATNLFPSGDGRSDYQIILTLIWKKGMHQAVEWIVFEK